MQTHSSNRRTSSKHLLIYLFNVQWFYISSHSFNSSGSTSLNSTLSRSNFEINNEDSLAVESLPERLDGQVKIFKFILLQVHIFKGVPNGRDSINAMQNYQNNSSDYNSNEDVPPKPHP